MLLKLGYTLRARTRGTRQAALSIIRCIFLHNENVNSSSVLEREQERSNLIQKRKHLHPPSELPELYLIPQCSNVTWELAVFCITVSQPSRCSLSLLFHPFIAQQLLRAYLGLGAGGGGDYSRTCLPGAHVLVGGGRSRAH